MNKTKKIAIAAVSLVMAGTMLIPLASCKSSKRSLKASEQAVLEVSVDENGNLKYSADTTLKVNVGDKPYRSISYTNDSGILSGTVKLPDGKEYKTGDMKPAWVNLQNKLKVKFSDAYDTDSKKLDQMDTLEASAEWNIVTDSADNMTTKGTANTSYLLDFNNYLEYMPNYKAYLDANPVVRLALTSDTQTGAMYYAPYFDGDNDVDKYTIIKKNWVRTLLDNEPVATTTTFASQASAKSASVLDKDKLTISGEEAAVEAFMGKADWSVIGGDGETKISVKYSKALEAAKSASAPLGVAVTAAAGEAYTGDSGNIVDIMNFIINTKTGNVTGDKLLKVLQEYIDVTYWVGENKAYTKRSDVFNGLNAAWDADLMTALFRCVVTNGKVLDSGAGKIGDTNATPENLLYALAAREKTTQRTMDLVALAGELYGARGLESRFEYTYIDNNGTLRDARSSASTYEALARMSGLAKEGLLYNGRDTNKETSYYSASSIEAMMLHDYAQTQTAVGGFAVQKDAQGNSLIPNSGVESNYDFEPILTAVSKWDITGNGSVKYMRFTESWRSIKNTGFCVPYDSVKNDPEKLAAVLKFIDYIFTADGQIDFTYGPQATDENGTGGFWYNPEYNASVHTKADGWGTFEYEGKTYASKTFYKNNYIPTVAEKTMDLFYGKEVYGFYLPPTKADKQEVGYAIDKLPGNYTDFARDIIGTTLPLGLKNQGFEYQCTADCGLAGAAIVTEAVVNGAIEHVSTEINMSKKWYIEAPTALPLTTDQATWVKAECKDLKNTLFVSSSGTNRNLAIFVLFNGFNTEVPLGVGSATMPDTAEGIVELVDSYNLGQYEMYMRMAWAELMDMYDIIR